MKQADGNPHKARFGPIIRSGKTPERLHRQSGLAAGGLFFALFGGLLLLVTVFQILQGAVLPETLRPWIYSGTAGAIALLAICLYNGFHFFKNRRFRRGAKDTMHLMALRAASLRRDCGRLAEALQNDLDPGIDLVHAMLRDKLAEMMSGACRTLADVQKQYRLSGLKKTKATGFRTILHSPEEYRQLAEPIEFKLIAAAVARFYYQLEPEFEALQAARRALFTVMGDYARVLPPSASDIQAIEQKYRYNPPGPAKASRIAFALKLIDYFKKAADGAVPPPAVAKMQTDLSRWAAERMPLVHDVLKRYQDAWQDLIEAYDDMAPLPRGLDIR